MTLWIIAAFVVGVVAGVVGLILFIGNAIARR